MKTKEAGVATVREAQHHLSKLLERVGAGEEVVITRRGEAVAKLVAPGTAVNPFDREVDWASWVKEQREWLKTMPHVGESPVLKERESYRY